MTVSPTARYLQGGLAVGLGREWRATADVQRDGPVPVGVRWCGRADGLLQPRPAGGQPFHILTFSLATRHSPLTLSLITSRHTHPISHLLP